MSDYISSGAYSADVHRNLRSGHIYGNDVGAAETAEFFGIVKRTAVRLDDLKKTLFYGKQRLAFMGDEPLRARDARVGEVLHSTGTSVDLFHGALGLVTEAGEIAEVFEACLAARKPVDSVNLREEIGDCLWYLSVMAKTLGTTLEECAQVNTAKLRKRFPDNFTEDAALNRDLAGERSILESDPRDEVFASGSDLDS